MRVPPGPPRGQSGRADAGSLEADRLSLTFGDRQVLDGVSFSIPPGEVVGLLGPNGAGKTSAMRVLLGIVDPDDGEVRWRGRPAAEGIRSHWGYMPQERGLYVKMTVRDHLRFLGRLRDVRRDRLTTRIDELLEWVGLSARADDKIEQLSGGMQQRVQLAATLVHEPDVLVLDEPFSGLDPVAVEQLSEVIHAQAAEGRTVLFSSHQLDLVEDMCERIVLIDHGSVVLDGVVSALKQASGQRTLRVALAGAVESWADQLDGVTVLHSDASETLLHLHPTTDPLMVLDQVRTFGEVYDFGLELPRVSQLFREAVDT